MNRDDTAAVLGLLAAAWPRTDVTQQTASVWMDALADLDDADIGIAAARRIIKTSRWFPSIAEYRNEYEALAHAKANHRSATHGLPRGHVSVPPPPRLVAAARTLLAEMRSKRHNHHGPNPCPVCGGIKP